MAGLTINPDVRKLLIDALGDQAERCVTVLERLNNLKQALNDLPDIRRSVPVPSIDEPQDSILDFLRHLQWELPLKPKALEYKFGDRLRDLLSALPMRNFLLLKI